MTAMPVSFNMMTKAKLVKKVMTSLDHNSGILRLDLNVSKLPR